MKLFLRSIVFLIAITAFVPFASGQTLYWAGGTDASLSVGNSPATTDNNFNTANNWSTVPPNLLFGASGTPTVPGPGNIAVVQADLNNGTILGDFFSGTSSPTPVVINQTSQANTVAGLIISNAIFNTGGIVDINNTSGQTLTVAGSNAGNGDFVVDGGVTLNYAGTNGASTFAVTNGRITIGRGAIDTAYTNGGAGTFNIQSGLFTFDAAGTATNMIVGYATDGGAGGSNSTVTQGTPAVGATVATASTVITGSSLILGFNSASGDTWNVTNGSTLQTGSLASSYLIALGSNGSSYVSTVNNGQGSSGTLNISDNSNFNLGFSGSAIPTDLQVGTTSLNNNLTTQVGGSGTINQSGASIVTFAGTATTVELGTLGVAPGLGAIGGTGAYNLQSGTLNIGVNTTDVVGFTLGNAVGSIGTLTQTGGTLNVGNSTVANGTTFIVGLGGTGIYNLNGGVANFNNALTLNASGTLNLNGGTLNIATGNLAPIAAGTGTLNFGNTSLGAGGILRFTGGTTWTDSFAGGAIATNTTATIDASMQFLATPIANTITTINLNQNLTGGGGITLIGTDGTNGNALTTFTFNGANTYTGATTIVGGTLDTSAANITSSSALNIFNLSNAIPAGTVSVGTVNLTLAANGLAYAGALGGNGNLNIIFNTAGDTFAIKNSGSFTGNIVLGADGVTNGNFQVYSGTFANISDNGTGSSVTIGGAIGNGGNGTIPNNPFMPPASGTVNIVTATYTGLTTINTGFTLNVTGAGGLAGSVDGAGGTLNTPSIGGDVTANSGIINVTGATGIVGNVGTVTPNAGTITATLVDGNLANGVGGTFITTSALNSTSVAGTVTNSGTLASASPLVPVAPLATPNATFTIGTIATPTSLTQTASGTLNVRVNGPTADFYEVFGTANLAGNVSVAGSTAIGTQTITILNSTAAPPVSTLTSTGATALFSATNPVVVGNNLTLTTTQLAIGAFIAPFGATPNELAVATAIDGTQGNVLKNIFNSIPAGSGAAPFMITLTEQLTPESLQYARNIAFENSTFLAERVNGMCAALQGGYGGLDTSAVSVITPGFESGLGRSLGSLLAYDDPAFHSSAPNGVNYYPGGQSGTPSSSSSPTPTWDSSNQVMSDSTPPNPYMATQNPSGPETPAMSEFIGGDVILADLNQSQSAANAPSTKANYTAGDATAGVSFRVANHFAAGVLFDYNHTDATTDSSGSKTKVDTYSPGLFATYFDHGFYANGLLSFGWNNYKNSRNISTLGSTANSSPSGQQYVGDLDFGYDFHPAKNWVVGPTLGATYTHLNIDSFTESGAAATGSDLSVDSQSVDSLRSRLGGHVAFQTNTGDVLLQPNLTAMWQHEYLDNNNDITSSLSDIGSAPFTIQAATASKDSALIGVGLTATLSNSMVLYLNYLADVGANDYWAQSVVGGFKARF